MNKVIFLVGAPGSGKDFILRQLNSSLKELSLDKLYTAISNQQDLLEVDSHHSLIVNGNAERFSAIQACRMVLEAMGYETAMLFVYTTDEVSKSRNDARIAKGAKTFTESQRQDKYNQSVSSMKAYNETFKPFWLINNSADARKANEDYNHWMGELAIEIDQFLGETQTMKDYVKHMSGARVPPPAPAPAVAHQSTIKGFERVKDGNRWVLRRKTASESTKYSSLNQAFENYSATAVDNSRGNTNVTDNGSPTENPATVMAKVLKPKQKIPGDTNGGGIRVPDQNRANPWPTVEGLGVSSKEQRKNQGKSTVKKGAAPPPGGFYNSKMGMVPSGSLGITSEYKPTGTPLSELRKKMRK